MPSTTYLYWIHYPSHTDPLTQGYIGVSKKPNTRFKYHAHPKTNNNSRLFNSINKGATLTVISEHSNGDDAYAIEETMRPTPRIGWNLIAGGGENGRPPVHWGNSFATGNHAPRHSTEFKQSQSKLMGSLKWWTDGLKSRRLRDDQTPPDGWWRGKTQKRS